ncbi:hypothetical protein QTN25_005562 [Entamoeba marina]
MSVPTNTPLHLHTRFNRPLRIRPETNYHPGITNIIINKLHEDTCQSSSYEQPTIPLAPLPPSRPKTQKPKEWHLGVKSKQQPEHFTFHTTRDPTTLTTDTNKNSNITESASTVEKANTPPSPHLFLHNRNNKHIGDVESNTSESSTSKPNPPIAPILTSELRKQIAFNNKQRALKRQTTNFSLRRKRQVTSCRLEIGNSFVQIPQLVIDDIVKEVEPIVDDDWRNEFEQLKPAGTRDIAVLVSDRSLQPLLMMK